MRKYLLFNEQATTADVGAAAHDVACYPVEAFLGFTNEGTTETEITMYFRSLEGEFDTDADAFDKVVLTITENKQVKVMKDIIAAINGGPHSDGVVVISDAETGTFVSDDVTGAVVTVNAAD
tara:strand:+ start:102 stop:467 length:366 start_codon:yes stop_codon:yes gene_type:complete